MIISMLLVCSILVKMRINRHCLERVIVVRMELYRDHMHLLDDIQRAKPGVTYLYDKEYTMELQERQ